MNRLHSIVARLPLLFLSIVLVEAAQNQFTIDATRQPAPPARARGFFPGSPTPGHSPNLAIRLDLLFGTGDLRPDGTTLLDFVITNVGTEPIIVRSTSITVSPESLWLLHVPFAVSPWKVAGTCSASPPISSLIASRIPAIALPT